MAANTSEIDNRLRGRIKDVAGSSGWLSTDDRRTAIASAVEEYQKQHPREIAVKIDGDGGFDYPVATALPDFVAGFSNILGILYPYLASDQRPPELAPERYGLVLLPTTGLVLRFFDVSPSATEDIAVVHTAPHTLNDLTSTIPLTDNEAIADLAAHYALMAMANYATQETQTEIQADTVNRLSKAQEYRAAATRYREAYERKVEHGAAVRPGFAVAHILPPLAGPGGIRPLFHRSP